MRQLSELELAPSLRSALIKVWLNRRSFRNPQDVFGRMWAETVVVQSHCETQRKYDDFTVLLTPAEVRRRVRWWRLQPGQRALEEKLWRLFGRGVARLPDLWRRALRLSWVHGKSLAEVGRDLGGSEQQAGAWWRRGRLLVDSNVHAELFPAERGRKWTLHRRRWGWRASGTRSGGWSPAVAVRARKAFLAIERRQHLATGTVVERFPADDEAPWPDPPAWLGPKPGDGALHRSLSTLSLEALGRARLGRQACITLGGPGFSGRWRPGSYPKPRSGRRFK